MGVHLMGVYLMGVYLTGVHLIGVYLKRASHRHAPHGRVRHGRTPHKRVFYGRVYVSKSKKALGKPSRSPTVQMVVDCLDPSCKIRVFALGDKRSLSAAAVELIATKEVRDGRGKLHGALLYPPPFSLLDT